MKKIMAAALLVFLSVSASAKEGIDFKAMFNATYQNSICGNPSDTYNISSVGITSILFWSFNNIGPFSSTSLHFPVAATITPNGGTPYMFDLSPYGIFRTCIDGISGLGVGIDGQLMKLLFGIGIHGNMILLYDINADFENENAFFLASGFGAGVSASFIFLINEYIDFDITAQFAYDFVTMDIFILDWDDLFIPFDELLSWNVGAGLNVKF